MRILYRLVLVIALAGGNPVIALERDGKSEFSFPTVRIVLPLDILQDGDILAAPPSSRAPMILKK